MKCIDMTADQLRHLALRCTDIGAIKLKAPHGKVSADSGDYFAYPGKTEPMKRYWRAAKKDLMQRELNGGSYAGDVGHVLIGGKRFSYYPKSGMVVRDDFAQWCEANFEKYLRMDGSERDSTRAVHQDDVTVDAHLKMWKDIRRRALEMPAPERIYPDQAWHSEYVMRSDLNTLARAIEDCARQGAWFPLLKCDADLLASKIAYRQRKYAQAKNHLLNLAAAAMRAALFVQEHHSVKEGEE